MQRNHDCYNTGCVYSTYRSWQLGLTGTKPWVLGGGGKVRVVGGHVVEGKSGAGGASRGPLIEAPFGVNIEEAAPVTDAALAHETRLGRVAQAQVVPVRVVDRRVGRHALETRVLHDQMHLQSSFSLHNDLECYCIFSCSSFSTFHFLKLLFLCFFSIRLFSSFLYV